MKKAALILVVSILLLTILPTTLASSSDYVTFTGSCNVRSQPNLDASVLGSVSSAGRLDYAGDYAYDSRNVIWYSVYFNGTIGWVSSNYAVFHGSLSNNSSDYDFDGYIVIHENCNVRSGPNLGASVIGTATAGTRLNYLGDYSFDDRGVEWYYVYYNGTTGWVSSAMSSYQEPKAY